MVTCCALATPVVLMLVSLGFLVNIENPGFRKAMNSMDKIYTIQKDCPLTEKLDYPFKELGPKEEIFGCYCTEQFSPGELTLKNCDFNKDDEIMFCWFNGVIRSEKNEIWPEARYSIGFSKNFIKKVGYLPMELKTDPRCNYDLYLKNKSQKKQADVTEKLVQRTIVKQKMNTSSSIAPNHSRYKKATR